jgi:hypothetical protein
MPRINHIGMSLITIWICLISGQAISADNSPALQPFTAQYQLNRGGMIIGKVTNTLQLDTDGSYTYRSVTIPVGIVAVFSKDKITEESRGSIHGRQIIPSSYSYNHKRKKHPKLRKIEFDWSKQLATGTAAKPQWSKEIPKGTQDKASMVLSMMQAMTADTETIKLQVADKNRLKEYLLSAQKKEQIKAGGTSYNSIKLAESKSGNKSSITFWLAPELNYLPVQIRKREKKDTYTMKLVKYTQGQPATTKK